MIRSIIGMVVFLTVMAVILFGNALTWAADDKPEWANQSYWRDGGFIYGVGICDAKTISNQALVRTTAINRARAQIARAAFAIYNNGITLAIGDFPSQQVDGYWDVEGKVQYMLYKASEQAVQNLVLAYKEKLEERTTQREAETAEALTDTASQADTYAGQPEKPSALPGYPQLQFPTQTPFGKSWEGDEERRDIEKDLSGFGMPR